MWVRATVSVLGLLPGEEGEVDDDPQIRGLLERGLLEEVLDEYPSDLTGIG